MDVQSRIVIIGAGVFGLSTALELSRKGFNNIVVLDRHVPPVPDGSSVDISRIIRFDYSDPVYTGIAKEAYDLWSTSPKYTGIFFPSPFILVSSNESGRSYIDKCTEGLDTLSLPWQPLKDQSEVKRVFPRLSGSLVDTKFHGYCNFQAGWADAQLAIASLRDQCIEAGVSFISGSRGTVTGFNTSGTDRKITAVNTASGDVINGDRFILATGAWSSRLVDMCNSTLATGQVLGFLKLTPEEVERYQDLPIFINMTSGWFSFPPHNESGYLKLAIHGWGYTRIEEQPQSISNSSTSSQGHDSDEKLALSHPPIAPRSRRANFAPEDGIARLRAGLKSILPELASREFERTSVCWYTDTPTGDFIMDFHPDYKNLFVATGGSGHGFKFLPVLGKYAVGAMERSLPSELLQKWRFRHEYRNVKDVFKGDGSRGGPVRREFTQQEKAKL